MQSEQEKEGLIKVSEEGNSITPGGWPEPEWAGGGAQRMGGQEPKRGKMSIKQP